MRSTSLFVTLALALVAPVIHAQEGREEALPRAELALSNDTLQAEYIGDGGRVGGGDSRMTAAFFLSEERDIVLSGGLLFPADVDLGRISASFGPRAYAALLDEENNDVLSLSVGAQLRFELNRRNGLAIVGHAFYAPDILTFGSADNLTDLSARAEMRLAERLIGFAGMRWFEFDLTEGGGEQTLQEEIFVGAGFSF